MQVAITIVGVAGCLVALLGVVFLFLALLGRIYERANRDIIQAAQAEERARITNHYFTTSWWFSEYPDAKEALRLVTEEIVSGRRDSSQLRADFLRVTGRKP